MESEQMQNGSMAPLIIEKENFTVRFNGKKEDNGMALDGRAVNP